MTSHVIKKLTSIEQVAINSMKVEIESSKRRFNLESLLSKISEKEKASGNEKLC
jgi:hypothetical protein